MYRRIHVIVNPAAGQDRPILGVLNRAFLAAGVDWDLLVTKGAGDARRLAQAAAAAGVDAVAAYGGDGTVAEAAGGLIGTAVPLAIFPGGTANVLAAELGIPGDLAEACALVCAGGAALRQLDVGVLGERYFVLRVGIGLEAAMVDGANRAAKERLGSLAYAASGLAALRDQQPSRYCIVVDGREVRTEGVACIIANAGSLGRAGLSLGRSIDPGDGVLDVLVLRQVDLPSLLSVAARVVAGGYEDTALCPATGQEERVAPREQAGPFQHWQGREVMVTAEPPQLVQADGEVLGRAPVHVKVIPQAVRVIVPRTGGDGYSVL
jgi:diacylglycerol kinase family enzyme